MDNNEKYVMISRVGVARAALEGVFDVENTSKPLNREIAIFGDSRTAMCHTIAATAYATENYGYAFWACALSGKAFCPYTNNFGVGGDTTAQMLARIKPVVDSGADIVLFMGGTNDRIGGMSVADTKRNITAIVRRLTKAGKIVIVANDTPRFGDKALTPSQQADHEAVRDWITNELPDITPVVDTYSRISQDDLHDSLHPNPKGAYKIGSAFAEALTKYSKLPVDLPVDSTDTFSAFNITGSLVANPLMSGAATISTASVNPQEGSVISTGFKGAGSSFTGVTTQWSKEAYEGGESQVITFSGIPTTAGAYLAFSPTSAFQLPSLAVGDVLSFMAGVDVVDKVSGILGVTAELVVTKPTGGTLYYRDGDKYQDPYTITSDKLSLSLETQRYTVDGTETAIVPRISVYFAKDVAQDSIVKIRQLAVRKQVA